MESRQVSKSRVSKVESEDSWESFLGQAKSQGSPIFVHFGASWCVPSLAMNPHVEELAMNHQNILFLTVDVDEVKGVAAKLGVKAMPTFMILKDESPVDKMVGANPEELKRRIEALASHQLD